MTKWTCSLAKTPLVAANAPDPSAQSSHCGWDLLGVMEAVFGPCDESVDVRPARDMALWTTREEVSFQIRCE